MTQAETYALNFKRGDQVRLVVAMPHMKGKTAMLDAVVDYPPMAKLTGEGLGFQTQCLGFKFDCPHIVSVESKAVA